MIRWLAFVCMLAAAPAHATQDAWPALFDVTGVVKGDVLNIRQAPDARAKIIGSFPYQAREIEVLEASSDYKWGKVNTPDGPGWSALAYLLRQPGQWAGSFPPLSRCTGTEPFWTLTMTPEEGLNFQSPETEDIGGSIHARLTSANRRDRFAVSFLLLDDTTGVLNVDVAQCSDGMSDRAYGFEGTLLIGNPGNPRLLSGCCTLSD